MSFHLPSPGFSNSLFFIYPGTAFHLPSSGSASLSSILPFIFHRQGLIRNSLPSSIAGPSLQSNLSPAFHTRTRGILSFDYGCVRMIHRNISPETSQEPLHQEPPRSLRRSLAPEPPRNLPEASAGALRRNLPETSQKLL